MYTSLFLSKLLCCQWVFNVLFNNMISVQVYLLVILALVTADVCEVSKTTSCRCETQGIVYF